jgi:hypothetical protein
MKNKLMKGLYVFSLLCLAVNYCKAQECNFKILIDQANAFAANNNYPDAINKLNSAKACDPTKSVEVDEQIQKLFTKIRKQKQKAINDERDAIKARLIVQTMLKNLQAEEQRRKFAEKKQQEAENKSDSTEKRRQEDLRSISNALKSGKSPEELTKLADKLRTSGALPVSTAGKQPTDAAGAQTAKNRIKTRDTSTLLWAEIRKTLDSLHHLKPAMNAKPFYDPDFDYSLEAKLRDSICPDAEHYCKKKFFESSNKIDSLLKRNQVDEDFLFMYVRSAYYYSWDCMDNNEYEKADAIISKAENILLTKPLFTKFYFCLAGLENAKGHASIYSRDNEKMFEYEIRAIQYANKAVLKRPQNKYYLKSLATFLGNVKENLPDSFLSKEEAESYLELGSEVADYTNKIDNKGFAAANTFNFVGDQIEDLVKSNRYTDAEKILNNSIIDFNRFIENGSYDYSKYIFRAGLYLKIIDIRLKQNDTLKSKEYINYALSDWATYIKGNHVIINDISDFKDTYDLIVTKIMQIYNDSGEVNVKYKYMSKVLDELKPFYAKQWQIANTIYFLNNYIGYQYVINETQKDSVEALRYYTKAVEAFGNSKILDSYTSFSKDFAKFSLSFDKSIKLNIKYNNYQKAVDNYNKAKQLFSPVYQKYPFDINMGYYLADINKLYGEYLYKKGNYKEAIEPLDWASYNGEKQSTEYLIKIYNTGIYTDPEKSNFYKLRDQSQNDGRKEYTINSVDHKKVIIELFDRAEGYGYKGIEDQAEWLRITENTIIPQSLVDKLSKFQDTAWQKNISFKELAINRFNTETLAPYKDLKDRINNEKSLQKRLHLFGILFNMYDTNLKKNSFNSDVIKEDAIEFYLSSAKVLLQNKKYFAAQSLLNDVLKLDPYNKEATARIKLEKYKSNVNVLVNTADIDELKLYLNVCIENKYPRKTAIIIIDKTHIKLDRAYLEIHSRDSILIKKALAIYYNDLAWNCLRLDFTDNVLEYLTKSIKLNAEDLYPQENLPHLYLLMGQFETAKERYLQLKDREFDKTANLPTFKDAFLMDLREFKQLGIKNDGIQKMIDILNMQ